MGTANPLPSFVPQFQPVWHVNAATGDDTNDGTTAGTALQSLPELSRRVGAWENLNQQVDVFLDSPDFSAQSTWALRVTSGDAGLVVVHGAPAVVHSGTLSAASAEDPAANDFQTITDNAALDWTPYIGMYVQLTSGPNAGALAVIARNGAADASPGGPGQAITSEFGLLSLPAGNPTLVAPAGNETYQILAPCKLPTTIAEVYSANGSTAVAFEQVDFFSNDSVISGNAIVVLQACVERAMYYANANDTAGNLSSVMGSTFITGGGLVIRGGGIIFGTDFITQGGQVVYGGNFGGSTILSGSGSNPIIATGSGTAVFVNVAMIDVVAPVEIGSQPAAILFSGGTFWGRQSGEVQVVFSLAAATSFAAQTGHVFAFSSAEVGIANGALFTNAGGFAETLAVSTLASTGPRAILPAVEVVDQAGVPPIPTAGPLLFANAGALKAIGTSGTVTTLAPAEPHCPRCGRDFAWEWESVASGEKLAVCAPCMLGALGAAGVDVRAFAFVDRLKK